MSNKWYSNPWIFLWRLKNKLETEFRQHVFKAYTANRNKDIHIYGKMHLINPNVRCGNNVSFYSDVLLFGDGLIEIGDNVDIGQGTIIYASANRGG